MAFLGSAGRKIEKGNEKNYNSNPLYGELTVLQHGLTKVAVSMEMVHWSYSYILYNLKRGQML